MATESVPPLIHSQITHLISNFPLPIKVDQMWSGSKNPNLLDRFSLLIPFCLDFVKWDVIFNAYYPLAPPDIIFGPDDERFHPFYVPVEGEGEYKPLKSSLNDWNCRDPSKLLLLILELRELYMNYQKQRIGEIDDDRLKFEVSTISHRENFHFIIFISSFIRTRQSFHLSRRLRKRFSMGSQSHLPVSVTCQQPEFVVPATPTPREQKPLSDIDDQKGLQYQCPFLLYYANNAAANGCKKDPVETVKDAISKALVPYYPLAGRLIDGPNRKLLIDCTGEGLMFVAAQANVTLAELGDSFLPPCPYLEDFFYDVPGSGEIKGCPVLLIQVTRLLCGGFVIAVRVNHTMMDAFGLVQFLGAVAEMARGATALTVVPVWQREYLAARSPPRVTYRHYEFDIDGPKCPIYGRPDLVKRNFFWGPQEIKAVREKLPVNLQKSSRFEIISACLWKCRTLAVELDPSEVLRFGCVINSRGKSGFGVPEGYYGNACVYPAVITTAGEICSKPLDFAIDLVKQTKALMSREYMQSVADLMVLKEKQMHNEGWMFLVSDNTRVGFEDIDFGWGKPLHGGPALVAPFISFYVKHKNEAGEDLFVTPMSLPPAAMYKFQVELDKITGRIK